MNKLILSLIGTIAAGGLYAQLPSEDITGPVAKAVKAETAPTIDGQKEALWDATNDHVYEIKTYLPFTGSVPPTGDADISGTWRAMWDDTYLYVLLEVMDDAAVFGAANAFELYTSTNYTRDYGQYGAPGYDGLSDTQIIFQLDTNATLHGLYSYGGNQVPFEGVNWVATATANGYIAEARLTWATLIANSGETGVVFEDGLFIGGFSDYPERDYMGFEVQVQDDDDDGTRDTKIGWWGGPEGRNGDYAWADTQVWGTLQLIEGGTVIPPCASFLGTGTGTSVLTSLGDGWFWVAGQGDVADVFLYGGFWPFIYDMGAENWIYAFCEGYDESGYFIYDFNRGVFGWTGTGIYPYYAGVDGEGAMFGAATN